MSARSLAVAVLGATGAVGRALLAALEESDLELALPKLYASERSAGLELEFRGERCRVEVLREKALPPVELGFLAASAELSRAWAGFSREKGPLLIDLSPAFRTDPEVPLVVPEVNPEAMRAATRRALYAVPGAGAALLALALAPLHRAAGVRHAAVVTLEAASGGGRAGVDELEAEMRALFALREPAAPSTLPHRLAFNVVPQSGPFAEDGRSEGEKSLELEVRRLLGSSVTVSATNLRVPIFYGHCQAVSLTTRRKLSADEARELLRGASGVKLLDLPQESVYPMPMLAVNDDAVLVGRVRETAEENGLELFVVGDNLRRGAATGAVLLAKLLVERLAGTPGTA